MFLGPFYLAELIAEAGKNVRKVFGKLAGYLAKRVCSGMDETQSACVQALSLKPFFLSLFAIDKVAEQRVSDIGHVYSYLVGASRFELASYVRIAVISREDLIMRDGVSGIALRNRHAFSVGQVTANRRINHARVVPDPAEYDRLIGSGKAVVGKLGGKETMRVVVFRGDDKPRGVHVDTVDDAGAFFAAYAGKAVPAMPEQGVDQSSVRMARSGVDDHAAR